jgi:hypothetical protein
VSRAERLRRLEALEQTARLGTIVLGEPDAASVLDENGGFTTGDS